MFGNAVFFRNRTFRKIKAAITDLRSFHNLRSICRKTYRNHGGAEICATMEVAGIVKNSMYASEWSWLI